MRVRRVGSDRGFTVVEMGIAMLIGSIVLALATTLLVVAYRTGSFTQGQSFTLNDARNAMQQIEREVRGADFINWCDASGGCLEVGAQTPSGSFETVKYSRSGQQLQRQEYDESSGTWSDPQTVVDRVVNETTEPLFACDTQSSLVRVTVDLQIEPTPRSDPNFNVHTSIRPRNYPERATCP